MNNSTDFSKANLNINENDPTNYGNMRVLPSIRESPMFQDQESNSNFFEKDNVSLGQDFGAFT